jgi:hypothetical protein
MPGQVEQVNSTPNLCRDNVEAVPAPFLSSGLYPDIPGCLCLLLCELLNGRQVSSHLVCSLPQLFQPTIGTVSTRLHSMS